MGNKAGTNKNYNSWVVIEQQQDVHKYHNQRTFIVDPTIYKKQKEASVYKIYSYKRFLSKFENGTANKENHGASSTTGSVTMKKTVS